MAKLWKKETVVILAWRNICLRRDRLGLNQHRCCCSSSSCVGLSGALLSRRRYQNKQQHQPLELLLLLFGCVLIVFIAADPRWVSESGMSTEEIVLVDSLDNLKAQGRSRSEELFRYSII